MNWKVREDLCANDLEMLTIEMTNPHSRSFLVSTWYRPPQAPVESFRSFESIIDKIDAESKEFYLLGDLNCNLAKESLDRNAYILVDIFDIYGIQQLIQEYTRITQTSKTLIDLCITNSPENVTSSGVIQLGISDHSLVYMCRKINCTRPGGFSVIKTRNMKHFDASSFLCDIAHKDWESISALTDPNEMWTVWKGMLLESFDRHAPIKKKRIGKKTTFMDVV